MGLTGSGGYDIRADNLMVDGVVAPSPILNLSMLSNVPVIGNLLTSRRGEGVFGMTYSINGHAAAPRVFVNPVSALTPGILRRIFEPVSPRGQGGAQGGGPARRAVDATASPAAPAAANGAAAARPPAPTRRLRADQLTRRSACFFLPSESLMAPSTMSAPASMQAFSSVTGCVVDAQRPGGDVALGFAV